MFCFGVQIRYLARKMRGAGSNSFNLLIAMNVTNSLTTDNWDCT